VSQPGQITNQASRKLSKRVSRRGFLTRAAMTAAALAVAPTSPFIRPATATHQCSNSGPCPGSPCSQCSSGQTCCQDGYTAFCCQLTGTNVCPSDTEIGGYWKCTQYNGNMLCSNNNGVRWYLDCNMLDINDCTCHCVDQDCNKRRVCCNGFKYPGCNPASPVTCIKCRIVRCTKPWDCFPNQCNPPGPHGACRNNDTCAHDVGCLTNANTPACPGT